MGDVLNIPGIIGNASSLSTSSLSYLSKTIHHECLGKMSMCSSGMTFSVWLRLNASVYTDTTEYVLINNIDDGVTGAEGFRFTTVGRLGRIETFLTDFQIVIKQTFPVPVEKWFYLTYRY